MRGQQKENRVCECGDFQENIPKINSAFGFMTNRGLGGYDGKLMEFCPWCAKKLKAKKPFPLEKP